MKKTVRFSRIAIIATLAIAGCFSHSKDAASATSSGSSGSDGSATSAGSGSSGMPSGGAVSSAAFENTHPEQVIDAASNNMPAFTVQVPKGWKFTGMIARPGGCHAPTLPADGLAFTAMAPGNITAFEKLPGVSWFWTTDGAPMGKCTQVKVNTAAEFLLNIAIPNMRPDARDIQLVPLNANMTGILKAANERHRSQGSPSYQEDDIAQVRIKYTLNGKPVEEMLASIDTCNVMNMPAYPMMHRAAVSRHICRSNGVMIRRAPQGGLDALLAAKIQPAQINQQWDQYISQNMQAQFQAWKQQNDQQFQAIQDNFKQQTAGMLQRGRDFQATQQRGFENAMAQDRATQGAIDHAAQMQVRDSLNRSDFMDPNTGRRYETSNQYAHNWISGDGSSIVLNDDATFDPNGVVDPVRQSWTELIPIN